MIVFKSVATPARAAVLGLGMLALGAVAAVQPALAQTKTQAQTQTQAVQEVSPDQLKLALKYVELTDTGKIYETMVLQAGVQALRTLTRDNPEIFDKTKNAIAKVIDGYATHKTQLLDQFARVYALNFTKDELDQMVAFYSTPTGQKLAKENRKLNLQFQRILQVFGTNLRDEFLAKVKAELKSEGINP